MSTVILLLLLMLDATTITASSIISKIHPCYVESYVETLPLRDCLNQPVEIETTRCRGQCYSEDFLVYDWQSEPDPYRHQRHIHCCSPNMTLAREISILCHNKQRRVIKYPFVTKCECKLCTDNCEG